MIVQGNGQIAYSGQSVRKKKSPQIEWFPGNIDPGWIDASGFSQGTLAEFLKKADAETLKNIDFFYSNSLDPITRLTVRSPVLEELMFGWNAVERIDLSGCPALRALDCSGSPLATLDLSPVPKLTLLFCGGLQVTELDFSGLPELIRLECGDNRRVSRFDFSRNQKLEDLNCSGCPLESFSVSGNPKLKILVCADIRLATLDLSSQRNLVILDASLNPLTEVNLGGNSGLKTILLDNCRLNQAAIDAVLRQLVLLEASGGWMLLWGPENGVPSATGRSDMQILASRDWYITTN